MNKTELIAALAAHFDGDRTEAGRALNAFVHTIGSATAGGERVAITGFGVFERVERPARTVRNPRTGERLDVPATAVPRFRAGTELKAYVSGQRQVPELVAPSVPRRTSPPAPAPAAPAAPVAEPAEAPEVEPDPKKAASKKSASKKSASKKSATKKTAAHKDQPTKDASKKDASKKDASKKDASKKAVSKKDDAKSGKKGKGGKK